MNDGWASEPLRRERESVRLIDSYRGFKKAAIARDDLAPSKKTWYVEKSPMGSIETNQEPLRRRSSNANSGTANAAVTSESRNSRSVNSGAVWFNNTRCVIASTIW